MAEVSLNLRVQLERLKAKVKIEREARRLKRLLKAPWGVTPWAEPTKD